MIEGEIMFHDEYDEYLVFPPVVNRVRLVRLDGSEEHFYAFVEHRLEDCDRRVGD